MLVFLPVHFREIYSYYLIQFKTAGSNKLVIVAPTEGFRGVKDSAYVKSYADSIFWSLNIVDSDDYGLIVNLTDLGNCYDSLHLISILKFRPKILI